MAPLARTMKISLAIGIAERKDHVRGYSYFFRLKYPEEGKVEIIPYLLWKKEDGNQGSRELPPVVVDKPTPPGFLDEFCGEMVRNIEAFFVQNC